MTYCLSLLCRQGIVFLSDSRTSAGVDNITIHPKMRLYANKRDRVLCLMSSGNLSLTQTLIALIDEDIQTGEQCMDFPTLLNQRTIYETARYVGQKIRQVDRLDREALERDRYDFNINMIVGGQIDGLPHQIYRVYPQGNCMHADEESPFLQIGEFKYGKPLLDRGFRYDTALAEAVKFGVLSLEATMKSNVSVGTPFDLFCYERDSLEVKYRCRIEDSDPYLLESRARWESGLVRLVGEIPRMIFPNVDRQPGDPRR